jgi:hypothetical protein
MPEILPVLVLVALAPAVHAQTALGDLSAAAGPTAALPAPPTPSASLTPASVASDYLARHRDQFNIDGGVPALNGDPVSGRPDRDLHDVTTRVNFQRQAVGGVPVEFTDIQVVVDQYPGKDPQYVSAGGKWVKGLSAPAAPAVSADSARAAVAGSPTPAEPGENTIGVIPDAAVSQKPELVLVPRQGLTAAPSDYVQAWKFDVTTVPTYYFYVDAATGKIARFLQHD